MATKSIAWNDGSGDYITLTYTGQGNGSIVASSPVNNGAARSKVITVETTQGGVATKNLTVSQSACPVPVGTILNYSYTGSYQEVELPAGQYKLQCWGAQGGSNGTNSSYGITAKAGGKGGYSEGILTLSQKTTVRVYVGGQGSSSAGGFNGGGSTTGTSQYVNSAGILGYSKMGGGGGATDIRLSDGALLSRMIVAGGGSGGAMTYKAVTSSGYTRLVCTYTMQYTGVTTSSGAIHRVNGTAYDAWQDVSPNTTYKIVSSKSYSGNCVFMHRNSSSTALQGNYVDSSGMVTITSKLSDEAMLDFMVYNSTQMSDFTVKIYAYESSTTTSTDSQVGYVGGGTQGGGYSSTYQGKQNAEGSGGSFGQGANQTATNYRYCSGAGGGGWYGGGGGQKSDSSMTYCKYSGGGSGFVNTAASAGNRPSGYTGLQLDSGETKAGNTSFPSTSGGTETGHSGNGYARITRLS